MKYYKLLKEFIKTIAIFSMVAAFVAVPAFSFAQVYTTASGSVGTATMLSSQLDFGARGTNVTNLQIFLAGNASWYPEGLVTGYFGPLTKAAVIRFQLANGLPGVGRVGPLTLAKINAIISGGVSVGPDFMAPNIYSVNVATYSSSSSQPASGSAIITWLTSENTTGKVFYSTSPLAETEALSVRTEPVISGSLAQDTNLNTTKSVTLSNLAAGTIYYYVIMSDDASGNVSVTNQNTFIAR